MIAKDLWNCSNNLIRYRFKKLFIKPKTLCCRKRISTLQRKVISCNCLVSRFCSLMYYARIIFMFVLVTTVTHFGSKYVKVYHLYYTWFPHWRDCTKPCETILLGQQHVFKRNYLIGWTKRITPGRKLLLQRCDLVYSLEQRNVTHAIRDISRITAFLRILKTVRQIITLGIADSMRI